uniref:Uncharacterized protein n=1 Tax=Anguilla anguilla TaxID=7936 RepID=A0A0E9U0P0_ANGAN
MNKLILPCLYIDELLCAQITDVTGIIIGCEYKGYFMSFFI